MLLGIALPYRGTSIIRKHPPPTDQHMVLGIGLL